MVTATEPVEDAAAERHGPPPMLRAAAVGVLVPLILSGVLAIFVALAINARPHDVTLQVVAPPAAVDQIRAGVSANTDGITVVSADSRDSAEAAIVDRTAEGALVMTPTGTEVLVSSAASPALSQMIQQLASGTQPNSALTVTDVVAPPSADARASGLASASFPFIVAGIALGAVAGLGFSGRARIVVVAVGALTSGIAFTTILWWLGVIDPHFLSVMGAIILGVAAAAATVVGLGALLGAAGVAIGAVTMMLIGNPLSGAASSPLLIPEPWSTIGQWMPPGASASLVRLAAYFPEASVAHPVVVLLVWLLAGCALWAVGAVRARGKVAA